MLLFLDTDRNASTGWLGYDFLVNHEMSSGSETSLKAWEQGDWITVGRGSYKASGNALEISLSRKSIGQDEKDPCFDFHWADNIQSFADVSEFGVHGDSAPNRRWNYRYEVSAE
jgi:hypothetical protein